MLRTMLVFVRDLAKLRQGYHIIFLLFSGFTFQLGKKPNSLTHVWVRRTCYGNSFLREMSSRCPASRHVHCEHGSFVSWSPSKEEPNYGMQTLVSLSFQSSDGVKSSEIPRLICKKGQYLDKRLGSKPQNMSLLSPFVF